MGGQLKIPVSMAYLDMDKIQVIGNVVCGCSNKNFEQVRQ